MKFADLIAFARELGADCLATGHYVRRVVNGGRRRAAQGRRSGAATRAISSTARPRDQLDFLRFPLGDLPKDEVRRIAAEVGLDVAAKPDSQDICFVPDGDYAGLVKRLRPETAAPGEIVDLDGRVLGAHRGVVHFTVGQRRGIEIGGQTRAALRRPHRARGSGGWWSARAARSRSRRCASADWNWLGEDQREVSRQGALAGAGGPGARSTATGSASHGRNMASRRARRRSLYDGTRLLGGGWIAETRAADAERDGCRRRLARASCFPPARGRDRSPADQARRAVLAQQGRRARG